MPAIGGRDAALAGRARGVIPMPAKRTCPKCGNETAGAGVGGLCPACLGQLGFALGLEPVPRLPEISPQSRRLGDYELLEEIARGGMGVVYKRANSALTARWRSSSSSPVNWQSPAEVQRFRAEGPAAGIWSIRTSWTIYEIGQEAGQHYFSMAYVQGREPGPNHFGAWALKSGVQAGAAGWVKTHG